MNSRATKIKVIIASYNNLIGSGIQAYISQCGYNVEYFDFESIEDTLINQNRKDYYLIIHHGLLKQPKVENLWQLSDEYNGKILVLGNEKMDSNFHPNIIFPNDSDKVIMDKLEDFFSDEIANTDSSINDVLSLRETDILKEVALGYSNKEIADRLFISINTVITHRKNITEKLGIKTIAGLTVYALMNNLINPGDVTI